MMVYVDTSVVLRRLLKQANAINNWSDWTAIYSSVLMRVEAFRTLDRVRLEKLIDDAQRTMLHQELQKLTECISLVQFSDTILENISYGTDNGTEEHVREAAEISQIIKDVSDFPQQFTTMLGERGITLSGGQKQRTSIARAVMRKPKILILDDALSAVDTYTEEEILKRLRGVMKGRTSIIISHRISTVKDADQIVVLDDGKIAERGTHDELVALGGIYAELHQKQLLEEELDQL